MLLCVVCASALFLLVDQYAYFKEQAGTLQQLQQQYQERVIELERAVADVSTVDDDPPPVKKNKKHLKRSLSGYYKHKRRRIKVRDVARIRAAHHVPIAKVTASAESDGEEQTATTLPQKNSRRFLSWPLPRGQFWLSSFFGRRRIRGVVGFHAGLDMAAVKGTPVRAAADGTVLQASNKNDGYGNCIILQHANNYKTRYAHLQRVKVHVGQAVKRGRLIGTVGNTGNVRANGTDGSHLHFEVILGAKAMNPLQYLI